MNYPNRKSVRVKWDTYQNGCYFVTVCTQNKIHYFGAQRKNLSSIIRGIKSTLTYYARCQNIPFDWQPRFYEHIIQSDRAFNFISNYIENNIINWEQDRFY